MSNSDQLEIAAWVGLAVLLGGLIGFQRELRGHEAGIRTSAIVCGAAALFGQLSHVFGDSDRIAAAVVQGVGFLCAGLIFQRRNSVTGITTAASVWSATAIGLAVAVELWLVAVIVTALWILILEMAPLSEAIQRKARPTRDRANDDE